jgi:cell wall-associated NlpC family hydrolase
MEAAQLARPRTRVAMVVPPFGIVDALVADLRATPSHEAELVDQIHYHEHVTVLASRGGWHYVQAPDHYFGWLNDGDVQVLGSSRGNGRCIGVIVAAIYAKPDRSSRVLGHLPAGTTVATQQIPEPPEGWLRVPSRSLELQLGAREAYVSLEDVVAYADMPLRAPTADDLIATAEAFLGVPYLWGGTTALGIDCSGYVQQVYRLNGIRLDRDADQQAMEGRPVEEARAGDLLFFGDARVTHVGLAIGDGTFLNAPEKGAFVERGTQGARKLQAIRRYLPDPE